MSGTPRPLVLVGAGGFGRETAELVADINDTEPRWDLLGFVDDDPALHGTSILGHTVLGPIASIAERDVSIAICVGRPGNYAVRPAIAARLGLPDDRYATLVHPSCVISRSSSIGVGSVVHAGCVATCDVTLGRHVAMMPATILTHDDTIDDHATIGAGVRLAGGVRVGSGAYVGAAASVREYRTIGARALVGMGSVVTVDVPADEIWLGVPARRHGIAPHAPLANPTDPAATPEIGAS